MTKHSIGEFLTGLSANDTIAVATDIMLYGNAFVESIDGDTKRRIPFSEWPAIILRHRARPIDDGTPGGKLN